MDGGTRKYANVRGTHLGVACWIICKQTKRRRTTKARQIKLTSTIDLKTGCSVPLAVLKGADALRVFFRKRFRVASGWLDCDMTCLNVRQKIHDNGVMSKRWFVWLEQKTINCCAKLGKRKGADESRRMSSFVNIVLTE